MSYVEAFLDEIRSWVGTPYRTRMNRQSKQGGTNCAQYVQFALEAALPPGEVPIVEFNHVRLIRTRENVGVPFLLQFCHEVSFDEIEPGDIAILEIAGLPVQPAVYMGDKWFIFCTVALGVYQDYLPEHDKLLYVLRPNIFDLEKQGT